VLTTGLLNINYKNKIQMENFTHYRLYNHNTGNVLYLLSISCSPDVDHQERLEKKKVAIGYEKNVDYNDMSWETTT
jgi:hypothetical protein